MNYTVILVATVAVVCFLLLFCEKPSSDEEDRATPTERSEEGRSLLDPLNPMSPLSPAQRYLPGGGFK